MVISILHLKENHQRICLKLQRDTAVFEYVGQCRDIADYRHGHIIAQVNVTLGKLRFDKKTSM